MPEKKRQLSSKELDLRKTLSDALAFIRGQETLRVLGSVTLVDLIDEQIVFLDDTEGESEYQGQLQRLEGLEDRLLGANGAIESARDFLPDSDSDDEVPDGVLTEGVS